jgi:CHAT domain-containing protein
MKSLDRALIYKSTSGGQQQLNYLYNYQPGNKSKNIYELIWQPLELQLAGIKKIYYSPAGQLHKISFAALSGNPGSNLSDKYDLVRLNTTGDVNKLSGSVNTLQGKLVLFGGIQYDADSVVLKNAALAGSKKNLVSRSLPAGLNRDAMDNFYYLKGSEKEISTITGMAERKNIEVSALSGIKATEESFKELNGSYSPLILHLATHGFFFPDPTREKVSRYTAGKVFQDADEPLLRSGLALAGANYSWKGKSLQGVQDGILTAYEVANMYLPNTKLAVLSACETGLGDIAGSEGVYGLQRAFKIAGAEHLVMTLWKVPDEESASFMELFYKELFNGKTIASSFREAQTAMKNKYRNDPYRWAAWILVK